MCIDDFEWLVLFIFWGERVLRKTIEVVGDTYYHAALLLFSILLTF